ncbi:MAG: Crp/Fnr family transcriptional regulator [Deltaproteobacteria bacterium]|nr:Crp/Fnr family transcriptional regulator [Deltaproteobacteria bacterium]
MEIKKSIDCNQCHPRHDSIFCDLASGQLQYLKDYKLTKSYQKHEIVFHQGDKPHGLFCVFSGLIKIHRTSEGGKEHIVRLAQSGDVLGYRSFFSGEAYSAAAQAVQESTICFIERKGIEKLIQTSPELIYALLSKVCGELREAEDKFQDLMEKTVDERLSHFIALFAKNAANKTLSLPLSREEIASLIGARPETVIRVFSAWKEKGWIDVKAKSLTLLKPQLLPH